MRVLILALTLLALPAVAQVYTCHPTVTSDCGPKGCVTREAPSPIILIVDLEHEEYARCDNSGCSNNVAHIKLSGMYLVIEVPGSGNFMRLSATDLSFIEVASLTTTAIVHSGRCEEGEQ